MNETISAETVEQLDTTLTITATADPTGLAVEWRFTSDDVVTAWEAGEWAGPATAAPGGRWRARALTPTVGSEDADVPLDRGVWAAHARVGDVIVGPSDLGYITVV